MREIVEQKGRTDVPGAAGRTTHPFGLRMPCLEAIEKLSAPLVETIGVPPQQALVSARPDMLETVVTANPISARALKVPLAGGPVVL